MEECNVGDVFYYLSRHLKGKTEQKHYHPIVVSLLLGDFGMPQKGVVIISSHTKEREDALRERFGEGSYVIVDQNDYSELSHKSIISGRIHPEGESTLLQAERKQRISDDIVRKIREAGKKHPYNPKKISRLL